MINMDIFTTNCRQFFFIALSNLMAICVANAVMNATLFTPYTIECPVVPLRIGNRSCQCHPQNLTVIDSESFTAFEYVSCELTPDLISPRNPKRFYFPRSKNIYLHCTMDNSLSYEDFLKSAELECGDVAEEVGTLADVNCFAPFTITNETYAGFPGLQKLNFWIEDDVSINFDAFSPLKRLKVLSLNQLDLEAIHPGIFSGLTNLRELSLWGNSIRELPDGIFDDLQGLLVLSLLSNRLTHISSDVLRPLEFLNILYLNNNNISYIHPDAFRSIQSLDEVDLSENKLDDKFALSFLACKKLLLSHNFLTSFTEDTVTGLRAHTISLDMSYNLISSITARVFQTDEFLSSLSVVDLSNNRLSSLPKDVLRWARRLTSVDFRNNLLETLPGGLFDIQFNPLGHPRIAGSQLVVKLSGNPFNCDCRLTWFRMYAGRGVWIHDREDIECSYPNNLKGSSLFATPPDNFRCPLPDQMCPDYCQCYEIMNDPVLFTAHRVIIVECKHGNLTSIPPGLPANTSTLDLTGNNLKILAENMIDIRLSSLSNFTLTLCSISMIESGTFGFLNTVILLKLDGNNLRRITDGTFRGLTKLKTLYLNNSRINSIEDGVFLDTPLLTHLYLHANFLVVVPDFSSFPKSLELTTLHENPLSCSCNLISFQGLLRYSLEGQDNLTCSWKNNVPVSLGNLDSSYCKEDGTNPIHAALASLGAITCVLVVVFICAVIYKKNKTLIHLLLLRYFTPDMSDDDTDKAFDIFISYCQLDEEFVLRYLVPLLEDDEDASFSICLHHRHFIPGETISNNIVNAVAQSRRVILVLSENFLQSDWCMYEFRMAHLQALQDRCNTLLIITHGDVCEDSLDPDLNAHIRTTTYLESCDSKFKHKLFLALKRGRPKPIKVEHKVKNIELDKA